MKLLKHFTFWVSFFFFYSLQFFSFQSLPYLLQSGFLEFLHWSKLHSIDLESNMSLWFFGSCFLRNNKGRMFSFHNHGLLSQSATPDLFLLSIITLCAHQEQSTVLLKIAITAICLFPTRSWAPCEMYHIPYIPLCSSCNQLGKVCIITRTYCITKLRYSRVRITFHIAACI